jgi:hypothetical protein
MDHTDEMERRRRYLQQRREMNPNYVALQDRVRDGENGMDVLLEEERARRVQSDN